MVKLSKDGEVRDEKEDNKGNTVSVEMLLPSELSVAAKIVDSTRCRDRSAKRRKL